MSRYRFLIAGVLALSGACGSDKSSSGNGDDSNAESTSEPAKAAALPPLKPIGKPAAELEAEGWTAAEIPPELGARLRDSASVGLGLGSPALRRELRGMVQPVNAPSFDSLGGLADTVGIIEAALTRISADRRDRREADIVDSLERAMEPRDPDLDAVSVDPKLLQPALHEPLGSDVPVHLVSFRAETRFPAEMPPTVWWQQSQTRTIQVAPGVDGTETSSSDGSTVTTEVGLKGGDASGSAEVSMKGSTTLPDEFEKQGQVGSKQEVSTKTKGKVDGNDVEEIKEGKGEERLAYCPDAAGLVRGRYKHWFHEAMKGTVKGVTGFYDITIDADFAITVQVNDEARATELLVEGSTDVHMEGGQRGGGNTTPIIVNGRGEGRAQGVNVDGPVRHLGSLHFRLPPAGQGVKPKWIQDGLIEELVNAISAGRSLAKKAEERWRNGACVEVIAKPESKALRYSGNTAFRAEVRHKRDRGGGAFSYPIRVMGKKTRWGDSKGDHSGARIHGTFTPQAAVAAPATFSYTAPAKGTANGQLWRTSVPPRDEMFPLSVSRRGIGVAPFYVPFDSLRRGYAVVYEHRVTSEKLGVERTLIMKAVIRELDEPDADGNTFAGQGSYQGSARKYKVSCDNNRRTDYQTLTLAGKVMGGGLGDDMSGGQQTSLSFAMTPLDPENEDGLDLVLPTTQTLVLTNGKAQDSRKFTMQSDLCRGTLTHVMKWSATRLK